jgi:hypothetical protein
MRLPGHQGVQQRRGGAGRQPGIGRVHLLLAERQARTQRAAVPDRFQIRRPNRLTELAAVFSLAVLHSLPPGP